MTTPTPADSAARSASWHPPAGHCSVQQATGTAWDAVRAPSYLADFAVPRLGNRQGAVIREPYRNLLYWFVPVGSTCPGVWPPIERVEVFGRACWIEVPPAGHTSGVGPYWLREPAPDRLLTDPRLLHDVLAAVTAELFGPRAEAKR